MKTPHLCSVRRRAFTLIELLVTITILLMVTAITIPMMTSGTEGRRIREAARIFSAQIAAAQSKALTTGRSAGIWIERLPKSNKAAMNISICESPPSYSGDTTSATATVAAASGEVTFSGYTQNFINNGDRIRFGNRGLWYRLVKDDVGPPAPKYTIDFSALVEDGYQSVADWASTTIRPTTGSGIPFQVQRQPTLTTAFKSASSTVQLPEGAVIDLLCSGMGTDDSFGFLSTGPDPVPVAKLNEVLNGPVIVMFTPDGAVDKVYVDSDADPAITKITSLAVTGTINFLIGNIEHAITADQARVDKNITTVQNTDDRIVESIWVSISPSNGLVTSIENVPYTYATAPAQGDATPTNNTVLTDVQKLITSRQTMGGR